MTGEPVVGSIARAARVLEALADAPSGCALSDLIERTEFSKTTTHRVLASLQEVSYVSHDPESRVYRLGRELAGLARKANHMDLASLAERGMRQLAGLSEDTVFLSVPEGAVAVCIAREVGSFPIRTLTLDRGDRRPMGIGAGALALYCALPVARRMAIGRANGNWLAEYGTSLETLEGLQVETATRGFALNDGGVISGMSAIGLPVVTESGNVVAAVAIGAISDRMTAERIETVLLPALRDEVGRLAERFSALESENLE